MVANRDEGEIAGTVWQDDDNEGGNVLVADLKSRMRGGRGKVGCL